MKKANPVRRLVATLPILGVIAGIAIAVYARFIHPFRFRVTQIVVPLPRAHANLDGLRIAFVTDTHVGPSFSADKLQPIVAALRRERPDILLLGGDFISESPRFLDSAMPMLGDMVPTARYGAFAVLGNHDVSNVRGRVAPALDEIGARLLENEAACIETDKGDLWIAGIDDAVLGKPDVEEAFREVPSDAACIALWHEPDFAEVTERYGPFLQLSGHTHGGQVRLPSLGPLALPKLGKRYPSGRYEVGDMILYVSNGIGMYRPPVRFNCPPELVIVRLIA